MDLCNCFRIARAKDPNLTLNVLAFRAKDNPRQDNREWQNMPPAASATSEGQKSIMSFFKKVRPTPRPCPEGGDMHMSFCTPVLVVAEVPATSYCGQVASAAPATLDASAASAATTPPPVQSTRRSAGPPEAPAEKKGKRKSEGSSHKKKATTKTAPASSKRISSRPSRASKSRAQVQLKERNYSSDSLMEDSEEDDDAVATQTSNGNDEVRAPSLSRKSTRKVRFSIDGDEALHNAVGGTLSPIAIDDDEVVCVGDELDTEKQDAMRAARQLAALDAVEGELGFLQYGKGARARVSIAVDEQYDESTEAGSANKRRRQDVVETPKVQLTWISI